MKNKRQIVLWIVILMSSAVFAQHRGDQLSFQGVDEQVNGGLEAMAMGGAYTAMKGTIDNLFGNAAGLTALNKWTFSLNGNYYKKTWWENQVYRPNRYFVTLPFYLEGLYVPDPKNNGVLDRDLALDSSYVVSSPKDWGKRVDSKEAADWVKEKSAPVFNSFALAVPFHMFERKIVVAAAYQQKLNFLDFDRNDSYLQPHIGYNGYEGWIPRVNGGDTLNVHWFKYLRERTGSLKSIRAAIATQLIANLNLSLAFDYTSGKSTDLLQLNKMGYFGLIDENRFFFTYDTLNYQEKGTSDFSSLGIEIGLQYHFDNLSLGARISLPKTLKRKWNYKLSEQTAASLTKNSLSGEDRFEIPAIYEFGLAFKLRESFTFSLNYRYAPYSKGTFTLARPDSAFRPWVDQHSYAFGARYQINEMFSLMAGYRWQPSVFVPDGVAYTEHGPEKTIVSFGARLSFGSLGSIIAAGNLQSLKYHDTYFSNTNYATEKIQNYSIGYVYQF